MIDRRSLWEQHVGRELDTTPGPDRALPHRIVACLNVWNDRAALEQTVHTWKDAVDHVIVVDGSYSTTGRTELSTDGTREYLAGACASIEFIDRPGVSQCEKRTAYLDAGRPGDYLLVIDADETLLTTTALDALPQCDVGWVRMRNSLYLREYGQPRVFRWRPGLRYAGRHHWIYCEERLLCTHQYGGTGFIHRCLDLTMTNEQKLGRSGARMHIKQVNLAAQNLVEFAQSATPRSAMSDAATRAREALRILNYAYRDDGIAPSRFHTAINRTTPHASVFFKVRPGPYDVPTQYDTANNSIVMGAVNATDVIHIHSMMSVSFPKRPYIPLVFHHHGSLLRGNAVKYTAEARRHEALVLVSNLELLSWTDDYPAEFLPNVVPVGRYRTLAERHRVPFDGTNRFRVAHSPSVRERKGTQQFLDACARLHHRGYPIEVVLIEDLPHAQSLAAKATCHAAFDSFWLGIQCSGLEAAAMRVPVIAGDATVAERYRGFFGEVPYTFADSGGELEFVLQRLMEDARFYGDEASRVYDYVVANHDESAVALTYLDLLDRAFHWRSAQRAPVRRMSLAPR